MLRTVKASEGGRGGSSRRRPASGLTRGIRPSGSAVTGLTRGVRPSGSGTSGMTRGLRPSAPGRNR